MSRSDSPSADQDAPPLPAAVPPGWRPILVTTQHRGVYFGLVPEDADLTARTMALKGARCAIYWGTTDGVAELAVVGPNSKSRIGTPADLEVLHDLTAVWTVTDAAAEQWLNA